MFSVLGLFVSRMYQFKPCPPAILCPVYVLFSVVMLLFPLRGAFICVSVYFVIYKLKKHYLPAFESSSLPACDRKNKPGTIAPSGVMSDR